MPPEPEEKNTSELDRCQTVAQWNFNSWHSFNNGVFWGVVVGTIAIASASLGAALSKIPRVNNMIVTTLNQNRFSRPQAQVPSIIPANLTKPINVLVVASQSEPQESNYLARAFEENSKSILLWQFQPKQQSATVTLIAADSQVFIPAIGSSTISDTYKYGGIDLVSQTIGQIVDGATVDRYISATPEAMEGLIAVTGNLVASECQPIENIRQSYGKAVGNCKNKLNQFQQQQTAIATLRQNLNSKEIVDRVYETIPEISQHLKTDLSRSEMLALVNFIAKIPADNLQVSLPLNYHQQEQNLVSNNRFATVIPQYNGNKTSTRSTKIQDPSISDLKNKHPFHNIPIAVQNTTTSPELAVKAISYLRNHNFDNVYLVDYFPLGLDKTEIILPQTKIRTANYLRQTLGLGRLRLSQNNSKGVILIRIGEDAKYLTIEDSFIR